MIFCIFGSNETKIVTLKIEILLFILFKILTSRMSYNMFPIMLIIFCFANSLIKSSVMEIIDDFLHFWLKWNLNSNPQNWDTFFILFNILMSKMSYKMFSVMLDNFCSANFLIKWTGTKILLDNAVQNLRVSRLSLLFT